MPPRRLPIIRCLLAYSVKLRDSTSSLNTQARRPWLAPAGFTCVEPNASHGKRDGDYSTELARMQFDMCGIPCSGYA